MLITGSLLPTTQMNGMMDTSAKLWAGLPLLNYMMSYYMNIYRVIKELSFIGLYPADIP